MLLLISRMPLPNLKILKLWFVQCHFILYHLFLWNEFYYIYMYFRTLSTECVLYDSCWKKYRWWTGKLFNLFAFFLCKYVSKWKAFYSILPWFWKRILSFTYIGLILWTCCWLWLHHKLCVFLKLYISHIFSFVLAFYILS